MWAFTSEFRVNSFRQTLEFKTIKICNSLKHHKWIFKNKNGLHVLGFFFSLGHAWIFSHVKQHRWCSITICRKYDITSRAELELGVMGVFQNKNTACSVFTLGAKSSIFYHVNGSLSKHMYISSDAPLFKRLQKTNEIIRLKELSAI